MKSENNNGVSSQQLVVGGGERTSAVPRGPDPGASLIDGAETGGSRTRTTTRTKEAELLDDLEAVLRTYVVLPKHAATTLALWNLHTYAFRLREVTTYVGVESPEKRCGKTTLLAVLSELVNEPVVAANISPPAFFRVIEETKPTLLIDEADTFLRGSDELRGIFNAGYKKKTAFVWRVVADRGSNGNEKAEGNGEQSRVGKFSCWCPKLICSIGRLPDTLADRCIVVRMQRKREDEECARLRDLDGTELRERCRRFVKENEAAIGAARPSTPKGLNDRAEEIWEPLLALADLAGGDWPRKARAAAEHLTLGAQEGNPMGSLLMDIFMEFSHVLIDNMRAAQAAGQASPEAEIKRGARLFTRDLVAGLNTYRDRPWRELLNGRDLTELWLSQRLRAYGIRPKQIRIGGVQSRGYEEEDFREVFQRYVPRSEVEELGRMLSGGANGGEG